MKKTKLGIIALVAALMLTVTACGADNSKQSEATNGEQVEVTQEDSAEAVTDTKSGEDTIPVSKNITVEVVDNEGNVSSYEAVTDKEFLLEAVEEIDGIEIEGTEGEYGLYIDSVNGITADYEADGAYWSLYVNGEYGAYSISEQPVSEGDVYKIAYEIAVVE